MNQEPPIDNDASEPMTTWVDADACPSPIKDTLVRAALSREIRTIFVANKHLTHPKSPFLTAIRVGAGTGVADRYIVDMARPGHLAITHDIPLAAELVACGVVVIDPRGDLYTEDNIRERLSIRNFMHQLREEGVRTAGPAAIGVSATQAFANTYDRELTRALRRIKHLP